MPCDACRRDDLRIVGGLFHDLIINLRLDHGQIMHEEQEDVKWGHPRAIQRHQHAERHKQHPRAVRRLYAVRPRSTVHQERMLGLKGPDQPE